VYMSELIKDPVRAGEEDRSERTAETCLGGRGEGEEKGEKVGKDGEKKKTRPVKRRVKDAVIFFLLGAAVFLYFFGDDLFFYFGACVLQEDPALNLLFVGIKAVTAYVDMFYGTYKYFPRSLTGEKWQDLLPEGETINKSDEGDDIYYIVVGRRKVFFFLVAGGKRVFFRYTYKGEKTPPEVTLLEEQADFPGVSLKGVRRTFTIQPEL